MEENQNETDEYYHDGHNLCSCAMCETVLPTSKLVIGQLLGSVASVASIVSNSLLLYSFCRSKMGQVVRSPFLYLLLLAPFDLMIGISHMLLFVNMNLAYRYRLPMLHDIWWATFRMAFCVSNISQTTAVYLLLGATIERYLVATGNNLVADSAGLRRLRTLLCTTAVVFAFLLKVSTGWEFVVLQDDTCPRFKRNSLGFSSLSESEIYKDIFKVYVRTVLTVVIPFIALAVLNLRVVVRLKQQYSVVARMFQIEIVEVQRRRIREATQMMVVIVSTYLISNSLHVLISIWEDVDVESLEAHHDMYDLLTDVISLLSVTNSALRLPTYMLFNHELRALLGDQILPCCQPGSRHKTSTFTTIQPHINGGTADEQPAENKRTKLRKRSSHPVYLNHLSAASAMGHKKSLPEVPRKMNLMVLDSIAFVDEEGEVENEEYSGLVGGVWNGTGRGSISTGYRTFDFHEACGGGEDAPDGKTDQLADDWERWGIRDEGASERDINENCFIHGRSCSPTKNGTITHV